MMKYLLFVACLALARSEESSEQRGSIQQRGASFGAYDAYSGAGAVAGPVGTVTKTFGGSPVAALAKTTPGFVGKALTYENRIEPAVYSAQAPLGVQGIRYSAAGPIGLAGYAQPQLAYASQPLAYSPQAIPVGHHASPALRYVSQPLAYAQPAAYAAQPAAYAAQPGAYAHQPLAYAPQPLAYAPQPLAYPPQSLAYSHHPQQLAYAAPQAFTYASQPVAYAGAPAVKYASAGSVSHSGGLAAQPGAAHTQTSHYSAQ